MIDVVERGCVFAAAGFAVARANFRPERPDRLARAVAALAWHGTTVTGAVAAGAARYPTATAIVDEDGTVSYARLWAASDNLAAWLATRGIDHRSRVGILAENSRAFVFAFLAASKLGADIVYLNTGFAGPQLVDVVAREDVTHLLHDDAFAPSVSDCDVDLAVSMRELDDVVGTRWRPMVPTRRQGATVILTSGTTGRPKGAQRSGPGSLSGAGDLLAVLPLRARDTVVIAAPLFHGWGLAHLGVGLAMSSTVVLHRRFDAATTLAAVAEHDANGLVVVPVMMQRMLQLGGAELVRYDTSALRYIASGGSSIPSHVVGEVLDRFGPVLYNVYGSTEVALASIATPAQLRAHPSTAGRVVSGSVVRILDDLNDPLDDGAVGRIFVANASRFDAYTGGGGKAQVGRLLSSGDVGHFHDGLLFVDGREDDMIVSGAENVFPIEVEDLIGAIPAVADVAVVGVPDDEFGQRLVAYVVRRPGQQRDEGDVVAHVRSQLARYKVPRSVTFVDELPRTVTGKLRRWELVIGAGAGE